MMKTPARAATPLLTLRLFAAAGLMALSLVAPDSARAQRVWLQQGPGPNTLGQVEGITDRIVVGAIKSVAAHPTSADVLFVGAVNGGIWRTGNATAAAPNWVPQLGLDQALNIGAIAYDPTDATNQTLIAGAGRFSSFNGRGNDRVGVWHTTNDGATWTLLNGGGTLNNINISGVAARGATLVISSNTASPLGNRGVWRSIDTGASFTQILPASGLPAGAAHDLASDPSNNARLFTNSGTAGIYRSDDTGATWTKVSDAAVDAALVGATNVKISVGDANNVYVAIVDSGPGNLLLGLFRSGDGGGTWTALDIPTTTESGVAVGTHPGTQGTTHLSIAADLTNDNVVYVAGDRQPYLNEFTTAACPCFPNSIGANDYSGRLFRVDASLAAGTQATHITHSNTTSGSSPHGDSRDMAIDANGDLIETDDGGIYRRTTPLMNAGDWFSVNGDIKVTEFHDIRWDAVAKVVIGGAQDTGTPEQITAGNTRWRSVRTADGGDVAVDDFSVAGTSIRYSSNQNFSNFRRRTVDATNTVSATVLPALTLVSGVRALIPTFKTPIAVNAVTPTRLVIAGDSSVYESFDQGETLNEIGPGIAVNPVSSNIDPLAYGAAGNADMLYVGAFDSVYVRNAAPPAVLTVSATYPGLGTNRRVADIVIDPAAPLIAYVIDATHVYRTPDGGGTWTDITGDLLTLTPGTLLSITYSTSNADGSVIVGANNGAFIASGPAFTTWTTVATGLPRVPVADVHYNPVDEILVAGTLGRGAWTVSLEERDPVDVALVLDFSGSMLSPACGGCDPKHQVLKDAVELFVQLWTVFTIPTDRLALNYFRTNITEFLVSGSALFDAQANAAAVIADVQGQTASNSTAMGGGIQQAVNRLTDATRPRNIILFTDGMQNVNPMVDPATFVIDNVVGRPNSNISPSMPATDLNAALAVKVNTIGVGATPAFVTLLDDIATETNGLFKLTTAPDDDLRRFYIEDLIDVLRTFSPQLIGYRYASLPADTATQVFTTNVTARRVVFKLSWKRGNQQFGLRVVKNGVDLTRFGRIISGPFYRIFSIDVPRLVSGQPVTPGGDWQVIVSGTKGTSYEVAGIVEEEVLEYEFTLGGTRLAGAALQLGVRLTFAGQPVTNATVTARVLAPSQSLGSLLSTTPTPATPSGFQYETGATAAQRKYQLLLGDSTFQAATRLAASPITFTNNGNGTYSATYANTSVAGLYSVVFNIDGNRADIGTYARTESRSVSVRFGTAVFATSSVSFVPAGRDPGGQRYELTLRPRDTNGNYLGPDYGHGIAVTVDGTPVTTAPIDRLDGSYTFTIVSSRPPSSTNVIITVLARPLYNGPLSGIQSGARPPTFALSAHIGAAIPASGFPSSAKTGLLLEADIEWRLNRSFSLEGVVGHYDFGSSSDITGATLFAKGYMSGATWRPYGAAGVGLFKPSGGSSEFGLSGAIGVNGPLAGRLEFDAAAGYTHVFSSGSLGFVSLKAGLKLGL